MTRGRPKGGTNKYWTKEEKEKIVLYHLNNNLGWINAPKNLAFLENKCING